MKKDMAKRGVAQVGFKTRLLLRVFYIKCLILVMLFEAGEVKNKNLPKVIRVFVKR
jgi:hypothetical protein